MATTEAQKRAALKYQRKTFKTITLKFRHEEIDRLRRIASDKGQSATAYCYAAVRERIAADDPGNDQ